MSPTISTRAEKTAGRTLATVAGAAALAITVAATNASAIAHAQPPSPGDPCPVLHETATDADGQTMWCNPMMTGTHDLVWQYGGPA